ncbi:MAG TPA: tyrosine-type recombinase/integrase [Candidatus Udaeobacter sp.]|nr:tyrosine-type recombinase/integrase [Candidatus Udaeobacter sp.]
MPSNPIKTGERPDGSKYYYWRVDIGTNPVTGKRKQLYRSFSKLKAAKSEYSKVTGKVNDGTFVAPSKLTVSAYLDVWAKSAGRDREKATVRNIADALRPVRERLGDKLIQKLTKVQVEQLVDWMESAGRKRGGKVGTGLGPRSVQLTLSRLRQALDDAVEEGIVVRNVAAKVRGASKAKPKVEPWTTAEVKAFLSGIRGERLQAVMLLSLMGLRPEEVCGIRWSDVDLDAKSLRIANVRTLVAGEVVEKEPKSEAGKRPLPLPAAAVTGLKTFKALQATEKLAAGEAYTVTGYVLVDELGEPVKTDWLRRRFYKLVEKTGVRKVKLYDARHACLTYLATNGVPDVIVSTWAGHADLSFTKRTYIHPDAESLAAGRDSLDALFGG